MERFLLLLSAALVGRMGSALEKGGVNGRGEMQVESVLAFYEVVQVEKGGISKRA